MRARVKVLFGVCALGALVAITQLLPGAATAQGQAATQRVIVVFKNQEPGLSASPSQVAARRSAIQAVQQPLAAQLSSSGALNVHSYTVVNAISATVSPAEETQLKSNPDVKRVIPDAVIHLNLAQEGLASTATNGTSTGPLPGACAASGKVQLNPQALETMHVDSDTPSEQTARSLGIDGAGVKVAFIADGLDINNQDFIRADGKKVFVDYKDFSGEGTAVATGGEEAFGDASSIAAQGLHTYDVSHYSPLALNRPCKIRVEGVAPGASLVGLDIFGREDTGFNSAFLDAIDYAVSVDHVNVLNESLGGNPYPDDPASLDLIKQANDTAVASGTTVTASSGDAGVTSTIGSPGTDPKVISAGATTTYRLDAQIGYGGARFPGVTGWLNNNISSFSSGGFAQDGRTVDVVAPGELNWALCSTDLAKYSECADYAGKGIGLVTFGGTSESAPLTAGIAALVIQAYRKTHGGATPTPEVVKRLIASSTDDIAAPADQQGAGLVDGYKAVLAAENYKAPASSPKPTGTSTLLSQTQLNAVDQPGTPETFTDTVTNTGATNQTITATTRALGAYRTVKTATVTLSDSASQHTVDWQGVNDNVETVTFNVPQGVNRLNASIAYKNVSASDLNARVRMTLVDPQGRLAEYDVPQGDGNYGNSQVANPAPGTWTAYIFSRDSADGGTTGPVLFGAQMASFTPFGRVTPGTLTLAPGQSGTLTLHVSTPATPGDSAGSIQLNSNAGPGFAQSSSVPVTLRSLIPNGSQSFTATLTGGNGRGFNTGQEFFYQLDVPAGLPELNAAVKLADNAHNPFSAWLVSPSGEALAYGANEFPSNKAPGYTDQIGAQLHVLQPAQGAWTLIVAYVPQVSGAALSEPFTVSTDQTRVQAQAAGVPNSAATRLTANQAATGHVTITNNGPAPEAYFVDARLPGSTTSALATLTSDTSKLPFTIYSSAPEYLVPTNATKLTGESTTTGPNPIEFDFSAAAGDPDFGSTTGFDVTGSHSAQPLSQGEWGLFPGLAGAFGPKAAPSETATSSATATYRSFDSAVTSPTGDLWLASTDPASLSDFDPVVVQPGQSASIPVTITPKGASGTTVKGKLYIDDTNLILFQVYTAPNGNQVTSVPYEYTIK